MKGERTEPGSNPSIHHSTSETRERSYARLRETGFTSGVARKIAEQATRQAHDQLNSRK